MKNNKTILKVKVIKISNFVCIMIILGLNFKHADASACLIANGKIIAAAEEERFVRLKHYNEFPVKAITFCLKEAKISLNDVDYFTLNNSPSSNFLQKIQYSLKDFY